MQIELYHASHEKLTEIKAMYGAFDAVFASIDKRAALSHADNLHLIMLDEHEILSDYELNYVLDYDTVKAALLAVAPDIKAEHFDRVWELVCEGKQAENDDVKVLNLCSYDDLTQVALESQRLRGQLAKVLGYKAVECDDEHGTSYIVNSRAEIKYL